MPYEVLPNASHPVPRGGTGTNLADEPTKGSDFDRLVAERTADLISLSGQSYREAFIQAYKDMAKEHPALFAAHEARAYRADGGN